MKSLWYERKSLFWKYLISYLLVLIIPTAAFFGFLNGSVLNSLEAQLMNYQISMIARLQIFMDDIFRQLMAIHTELSLKDPLNNFVDMYNLSDSQDIVQELKHSKIATSWLYDIVLHYAGDKYVFTGTTTCTVDRFFNLIVVYENDGESARLQQLMEASEKISFIPMQTVRCYGQNKDLLTICLPLYSRAYSRRATLTYLIDAKALSDIVLANASDSDASYLILGDQNELIGTFGEPPISREQYLEWLSEEDWENQQNIYFRRVTLDGERQMVSRITSNDTGYTYVSVIPMSQIHAVVHSLQTKLIWLSAAVGMFGLLLIFFSMRRNYNPIRQLTSYAKTFVSGPPQSGDELEVIHSSLAHLSDHYTALRENARIPFQNHFLQMLIQGSYSSLAQMDTIGELGEFHFDKEYFQVFLMVFSKKIVPETDVMGIERIWREVVSGYLLQSSNAWNTLVYVANFDKDELENLPAAIPLLYDRLTQAVPDNSLVIAAGEAYTEIEKVAQSHDEAVVAADYRFVQGKECIIWHKDLLFEALSSEDYPKQLFEQLRYALQKGETENIYSVLNAIIDYLKSGKLPLFYVRSLAYELINILLDTLTHLGNAEFSKDFLRTYSSFLSDFDTIDDLADVLQKLCMSICMYIVQGVLRERDEKLFRIKHDIEMNYTDVNFSVQALAEAHGMSAAGLSQYFKSQTGMTVLDYLTEQRMLKAKQLLLEGRATLNEIAEEVGYLNTSSFIRRFKSLYGLTPRQYTASQAGHTKESHPGAKE